MNKYKYIFVDKSKYSNYVYYDLYNNPEVDFLNIFKFPKNKILNFILKLFFSYFVRKNFHLNFLDQYYNLDNYHYDNDYNYCLIISSLIVSKISYKYLLSFKNKYKNVKIVMLLIDSMSASSRHLELIKKYYESFEVFDLVLSYDKNDIAHYGFKSIEDCYYSKYTINDKINIKYDLYYIAQYKNDDKLSILYKIFDYISSKIKLFKFIIVSQHKLFFKRKKGISYLYRTRNYVDVVRDIMSSNCLLEILPYNQNEKTGRYFDAILYNKKLITNNKNLNQLPYYDDRFMKYYNKVEDIDIDWISKVEDVDYKYKGEFSPNGILKIIEKYI